MKVSVHIDLVCRRVRCRDHSVKLPVFQDIQNGRWFVAQIPVRAADCVHQLPLPIQSPVGGKQRIAVIVNVGGFGSSAIQFNNLEILSPEEVFVAGVPNVLAANEKARNLT